MPRRSAWIVVALVTAVSLCFLLGWTTSSQASTSSSSRPPIRMTRQKTMEDVRPPCPHPIYCSGELLKTVQLSNFYPDAKTFVDMPCAKPVDDVLAAFALLPPNPSHQELAQFLGDNFMPAGSEMETWTPTDWSEKPAYLDNITDPELRRFAAEVNRRWKYLGRRFVRPTDCGDCYSSFDLPYPFIVPGGRFLEAYYWDTLWVVEGLLVSNMTTTVMYMLENMAYVVSKYGFMSNGNRIYYESRSQPPVFSLMAKHYYEHTKDLVYLESLLPYLYTEYNFWMTQRAVSLKDVSGVTHLLNLYTVDTNVPRPESYRQDYNLTLQMDPVDAQQTYSEIASAAESGWDFSSRWFADKAHMETIRIRSIIPVDLNSILFAVEGFLSEAARLVGDTARSSYFNEQKEARRVAIKALLWNETSSHWADFNVLTGEHTQGFYVSNFVPIWAGALADEQQEESARTRMFEAFLPQLDFECGVPTSDYAKPSDVPEQWDFPNSWPPLQEMTVTILEKLDLSQSKELASKFALDWLECNYCGWVQTGAENGGDIFEKYQATWRGAPGGGGEYEVQEGFGWTNGVILKFLVNYASSVSINSTCTIPQPTPRIN